MASPADLRDAFARELVDHHARLTALLWNPDVTADELLTKAVLEAVQQNARAQRSFAKVATDGGGGNG